MHDQCIFLWVEVQGGGGGGVEGEYEGEGVRKRREGRVDREGSNLLIAIDKYFGGNLEARGREVESPPQGEVIA